MFSLEDYAAQAPRAQDERVCLSHAAHNAELQRSIAGLGSGWTLADDKHPLGSLQDKEAGPYRVVVAVGNKNGFGATYFRIFIQNGSGELGQQPVLTGLHGQGKYPGQNWIEVMSLSLRVRFATGVGDMSLEEGLILSLFKYLVDMLPPGGHMMIEYDSAEQQDTADSLALGVPPVATPLGAALFWAGCGFGFKDWYFAEGGSEGPRKLQGHKALDSKHARVRTLQIEEELRTFLRNSPKRESSELEMAARGRALHVLDEVRRRQE